MNVFQKKHLFFPFVRLLKFIVGLAVSVQVIVITYNHFSGYFLLDGFQHFLFRLFRGTGLSVIAGILISYPNLFMIHYLNQSAPWGKKTIARIAVQFSFSVWVAVVVAVAFTLFANLLTPYSEELRSVIINNALIFAVVNIMIMTVFEGWIYFDESRHAKQMAENLQEELSQIRFEVLKSQINPHFMFNSLNVLSGLINKDVAKAQQFIDEFSLIYRYVLETIEQPVTTLG